MNAAEHAAEADRLLDYVASQEGSWMFRTEAPVWLARATAHAATATALAAVEGARPVVDEAQSFDPPTAPEVAHAVIAGAKKTRR